MHGAWLQLHNVLPAATMVVLTLQRLLRSVPGSTGWQSVALLVAAAVRGTLKLLFGIFPGCHQQLMPPVIGDDEAHLT
jgi:hypothetical protein